VNAQVRIALGQPFSLEEVKESMFGSNASGASGPDGFSFAFYQHFWSVVQDDLLLLTHHFYNNSLRIDKLSHTMVCLLPRNQMHQSFKSLGQLV
jgi:hypothetical protein